MIPEASQARKTQLELGKSILKKLKEGEWQLVGLAVGDAKLLVVRVVDEVL